MALNDLVKNNTYELYVLVMINYLTKKYLLKW